jgi:hypothetical protein
MTIEKACCVAGSSVTNGADLKAWRRQRLLDSGFEESVATRLADTPGVDLHALLNLVDRGCPPATAIRILGPFGEAMQLDDAP